MRGKNLTPDTKEKILSLRYNDKMRLREIAEALDISLSAVTTVIKRDPNPNKIPVHVRAKGRKAEAIRMMKAGVPSRDIAAALGIRRESVNALIKGETRPPGQASSSNRPKHDRLAERNARIVALHNEGKSSDWIASEIDICPDRVRCILRKNGINQGRGNSKARRIAITERSAQVARWHNEGKSAEWIANEMGVGPDCVSHILRKQGIRQGTGNSKSRAAARAEWSAQVVQWHNEGLSSSVIAQRTHRSRSLINRILHSAGIQRKNRADE